MKCRQKRQVFVFQNVGTESECSHTIHHGIMEFSDFRLGDEVVPACFVFRIQVIYYSKMLFSKAQINKLNT